MCLLYICYNIVIIVFVQIFGNAQRGCKVCFTAGAKGEPGDSCQSSVFFAHTSRVLPSNSGIACLL